MITISYKTDKKSAIRIDYPIIFFLTALTLGIYFKVTSFNFIYLDDPHYVFRNLAVLNGISQEGVLWAFTSTYLGNYHPLAWISHMVDVEIYGIHPGGHHLSSVFFHLFNTILLYFIFKLTTKKSLLSGFIAALFAIHPLHIESVVWIAERKDVLSTFFVFLALLHYISFHQSKKKIYYFITILFFIFALLTKPMVVTFPILLLLFDFWPLERYQFFSGQTNRCLRALIYEKIPLFVFSIISAIITVYAQHTAKWIQSLSNFSLGQRINNALLSYCIYLKNTIWPQELAIFYPQPAEQSLWKGIIAFCVLMTISYIAIMVHKKYQWFTMGWFWFLVTLLPVIGLIKVGTQAMADRYSYIPLIGIFVICTWGSAAIAEKYNFIKKMLPTISVITVFFLSALCYKQLVYWKGTESLFERTVHVTQNNYLIHTNLGAYYLDMKKYNYAIKHLKKSISIKDDYFLSHINLARCYYILNNQQLSRHHSQKTIELDPTHHFAYYLLAKSFEKTEENEKALYYYKKALLLDSNNVQYISEINKYDINK